MLLLLDNFTENSSCYLDKVDSLKHRFLHYISIPPSHFQESYIALLSSTISCTFTALFNQGFFVFHFHSLLLRLTRFMCCCVQQCVQYGMGVLSVCPSSFLIIGPLLARLLPSFPLVSSLPACLLACWMDGWMVGWMDGWMGGWMDGWKDQRRKMNDNITSGGVARNIFQTSVGIFHHYIYILPVIYRPKGCS